MYALRDVLWRKATSGQQREPIAIVPDHPDGSLSQRRGPHRDAAAREPSDQGAVDVRFERRAVDHLLEPSGEEARHAGIG